MATVQQMYRSVQCFKRSLLKIHSRYASGYHVQNSKSPTNSIVVNLNWKSDNEIPTPGFINMFPISEVQPKLGGNTLVSRIDQAILPMSPVEKLVKLNLPTVLEQVSLEMPTTKASLDNAHINKKALEIRAPQRGRIVKQLAIRMLVIRRKKMKKHQRKKFEKKFRVFLMTKSMKKFNKKETIFLSGLESYLKDAESFDAAKYVRDKINKAYQPLPEKEKLVPPLPWEFQPLHYWSKTRKS